MLFKGECREIELKHAAAQTMEADAVAVLLFFAESNVEMDAIFRRTWRPRAGIASALSDTPNAVWFCRSPADVKML